MLKLKNINTYYGKLHALKNISLHVSAGEIVALIGANGAGKTTILNTISAVTPPLNGEIHFDGALINNLSPDTVDDNIELGAYLRFRAGEKRKEIMKDKDTVYVLFPQLLERRKQVAGTLSGGEQQMLAIGRALMAKPKLLLLDEPAMGLAPLLVQEIFRVIQDLRKQQGTSVLLVEQNARVALKAADRGYVLETGKVILEETASELLANKDVQRAYLGRDKKEIWER
jgi:branched-chain amino acid transport system ATP-binding protein